MASLTIRNSKVYDLVIISAMNVDKISIVLEREKQLIDWLKWQFS